MRGEDKLKIGVPREIKPQEGRVALLPAEVEALTQAGHAVTVERGAGHASEAGDDAYRAAGAQLADDGAAVFAAAQLIVKVKEILPPEYPYLRADHTILTNIHGAANRDELDQLLTAGLTAIAAEDTHQHGSPNCALAGEVGAFEGLRLTLAPHGGSGRHFMRQFGAPPVEALVLGLGHVGRGALRTLLSLGVAVTGLDIDAGARSRAARDWPNAGLSIDDIGTLDAYLGQADLVVNCVLWPKHRDDHLIARSQLGRMKPGAVIADISCDEGGAVETCRATTWADPVYMVDGIRHFCVDNIPGAVPVAASAGYAQALLPKVMAIAELGPLEACARDPWLARGLTCADGVLTHAESARVQNRDHVPVDEFLTGRAS